MTKAALLLWLALAPSAPAQEPPSFPSDVDQVVVDVVVLGSDGKPVAGLTAKDFELSEDGKAQAVASFTAIDASAGVSAGAEPQVSSNRDADPSRPGRLLAMVFDEQHLTPAEALGARKAAVRFVEGLSPGDRLFLVGSGSGTAWAATLPEGLGDLIAALQRVQGLRRQETGPDWVSDSEAERIAVHRDKQTGAEVMRRFMENGIISDQQLPPPRDPGVLEANQLVRETMGEGHPMVRARAAQVWAQVQERRRATLGVLERTLRGLAARRGRKTVFLVSAGFLHEATDPAFARVQEAARRANAVVYFVDARVVADAGTSQAELGRAIDVRDVASTVNRNLAEVTGAASVAVDSGGERIGSAATLPETLARLADEGRSYYLLGYVPSRTAKDGKFHKIDVKVSHPGATVRARRGYYALGPEAAPAPAAEGELPADVRRSLLTPFGGGDVGLRLKAFVLGPLSPLRSQVVLVGEADPATLSVDASMASVETYLMIRSQDGAAPETQHAATELVVTASARAFWLPLRLARELSPGGYEARLFVRDRKSGRAGTVVHAFQVPETTAFRLSTPVLTDGLGSDGRSPSLIARRSFPPGARLMLQLEVQGAALDPATGAPRVSVTHEVKEGGGSTTAHPEPTLLEPGPDGRLAMLVTLTPPAAGAAEVVIGARDEVSGQKLEAREAFRIDASLPASR